MGYEQDSTPGHQQVREARQRMRPRYQGPNFIPADKPPRTIEATVQPMPITDMSEGWKGTVSPSQDSTGAVDRAQGFNRRMVIPMVLTVILALVATLAWVLVLMLVRGDGFLLPYMLDRLFIFLTVQGGLGFWVWQQANEVDYAHTQAGKERLRLDVMRDIRIAEITAETEQRKMALLASLRLLDRGSGDEMLQLEMADDEYAD